VDTWPRLDLAEFQDETLTDECSRRVNSVRHDYAFLLEEIAAAGPSGAPLLHGKVTFDLFHWALQTYATRSFGFFDIPGRTKPTIVPIADLLNHRVNCYGYWNDQNGRVAVHGDLYFPKGSEVCIAYGPKS
jgi:hypothetical protein